MKYGRDSNNLLILRFFPVVVIQFRMAGLGLIACKTKKQRKF